MADYKKIKHGDLPGDYPKQVKIRMREGPNIPFNPDRPWVNDINGFIGVRAMKSYRKMILMKARAVLKRRTRREIEESCVEEE